MSETIDKIKSAMGMGPKVKVVGQIDLDSMNQATRPAKKSKEERKAERQKNAEEQEAYNRDFAIRALQQKRDKIQEDIRDAVAKSNELKKQISDVRNANSKERDKQETRLAYLRSKQAVRESYNDFTMTNTQRQKDLTFQGLRPQKMDVVHFHVPKTATAEEMDGVALVRDENHYYIAVDMYEHTDRKYNETTMMDENPDGTFDGIWPKHTCLKAAAKFEERYMRELTDKYADDLEKAEEFIESVRKQESLEIAELMDAVSAYSDADFIVQDAEAAIQELEDRIKQLNADLLATDGELRKKNQEPHDEPAGPADGGTLLDFSLDDIEFEPMEGLDLDTPTERKFMHLPYVRGHRQMTTMNWPQIEDTYEAWLRFRLMSNIARLVFMLRKAHALTYVLTDEYYEEMSKRGREYYKSMKIDDVVPHGEAAYGALVYPSQGYQDTVLYRIDNRNQLSIIVVYLREDRLMFYESYSMQEVLNHPRTDHFICHSFKDSGTDPNRLFSWIRNLLIAHLSMEHDMERVVRHLVEEDKGSAIEMEFEEGDDVDTTDDRDVVMRDYKWYTDLTINREIPVRGYISHRWCGTGKDKIIKEVWVRPHVKHGYHREAGVKK